LIPAGGGSREMACRAHEAVPEGVGADIFPFVKRSFETISQATTSTSGPQARTLGFLRETDLISMNRDRALADAKRSVIYLSEQGFRPPRPRSAVRVVGRPGLSELKTILHQYRQAGWASDYDVRLGTALATVLCGGDVDDTLTVDEQHLLDLEREIFKQLCGEPKTHERIEHTLKTGKPLRN
jgi:3-hydroxyacyl-CoA dehydrogenase